MAQIGAYGSIKVCRIRAARLNPDTCAFDVSGSDYGAVSDAIVSLTSSAEYEPGQEYVGKNGCGDIVVSVKETDKLKRVNLQGEFITRDLELLELLSGADLFQSTEVTAPANAVIGMTRRAVGAAEPDPVSLEVWTRAADVSGECGGGSTATWWRWVWPKTRFTLGDVNLDNNVGQISVSGISEPNPNWNLGPDSDWPATSVTRGGVDITTLGAGNGQAITDGGLPTDVAEAVILEPAGYEVGEGGLGGQPPSAAVGYTATSWTPTTA